MDGIRRDDESAENLGTVEETRERIKNIIIASAPGGDFVKKILGRELDL